MFSSGAPYSAAADVSMTCRHVDGEERQLDSPWDRFCARLLFTVVHVNQVKKHAKSTVVNAASSVPYAVLAILRRALADLFEGWKNFSTVVHESSTGGVVGPCTGTTTLATIAKKEVINNLDQSTSICFELMVSALGPTGNVRTRFAEQIQCAAKYWTQDLMLSTYLL